MAVRTKRKQTKVSRKSKRYGEGDLVIVEWLDAAGDGRWTSSDQEPLPLEMCYSVGWIQRAGKDCVSLYADRGYPVGKSRIDSLANRNTIPTSCIRKVTVLNRGQRK